MPRYVKLIMLAALVALALWIIFLAGEKVLPGSVLIIKYILTMLLPFILAVIVSVLLEPLVSFFQLRMRFSRGMAVTSAMVIIIGGAGTLLVLLVLQLVAELIELSASLDLYMRNGRMIMESLVDRGINIYGNLPPTAVNYLQTSVASLADNLKLFASKLINAFLHMVYGIPGIILVGIVSLLAAFFISKDRDTIFRLWRRCVPAPWGERSIDVSREVSRAFMAYIRSQLILVTITMVQCIAGLYIIGIDYALTIGLTVGFFDLIPVLGPGSVFIPWIAWSLFTGDYGLGIKLSILFALILLVRQLLEAKIVSANLGLHPLATLLAIYVGLKVFGVLGLILGPMALIALQAGYKAGRDVRKFN
ncbi:sporulation integral membrane protein YtvI [Desulfofarcimen acetoxidans DSM 771]|uniref:Sporulation integral membrane protein YtvI n=1 Tax=Desulfofarcimen acetoxidans (strain ATCC 49208 / DSM 771 / KCTC 5769 / VKM B-1644 / 5575) TaxID=485916 RepID=C8W4R1_DESAS|nr:sporulation integral membrane protein YtvI [Desulfofarcimen acetoxidans]ACV63947.1 sporulation integral membrane protein YtvI [Desulfofarcimen acetoxidans DSM 771]